jgi:hypothetical protein
MKVSNTFQAMSLIALGVLIVTAFSLPTVAAASVPSNTPAVHYHQSLRFLFAGSNPSSGNYATLAGLTTFTGGAKGLGFVIDPSGANSFTFKMLSFSDKSSVCSGSININAIVIRTTGNGLRTVDHQSIAILLSCKGPKSVTIAAPSCVVGNPSCKIAPLFYETFTGYLQYSHA